MKIYKAKKKILLIIVTSCILSLVTASYFEIPQAKVFAAIKYLFKKGSFSRFIQDDETLYTYHNGDYYINPVHVFQQVVGYSESSLIERYDLEIDNYSNWQKSSKDVNVLRVANFMIENYKIENIDETSIVRFPYNIDYASYDLKSPWYSGMAQGHAVIVFLHAYKISNDVRYLNYAKLSANTLSVAYEHGGVLIQLDDNSIWFEEYADPKKSVSLAPRVLNGNIFAIDGLFWVWYITQDDSYKNLLISAINGVEKNINKYDSGGWSYYGLWYNYAHAGYHSIHIQQLKRIIGYSKVLEFSEVKNINYYKNKFIFYQKYSFLGYIERMLFQRNNMIYIIFIFNFLLIFLILNIFTYIKHMHSNR